jgi:hypothetical protein
VHDVEQSNRVFVRAVLCPHYDVHAWWCFHLVTSTWRLNLVVPCFEPSWAPRVNITENQKSIISALFFCTIIKQACVNREVTYLVAVLYLLWQHASWYTQYQSLLACHHVPLKHSPLRIFLGTDAFLEAQCSCLPNDENLGTLWIDRWCYARFHLSKITQRNE